MHNKYINEQFGTESEMINKALTGQVSTVSQKELLKSVHPKYHPLVKKGLDVWRTNPSTIYRLHDFLEYTQLYAPYSHPLNSMITNAARQNINFNSVDDIHKYIDDEAKRLKWSKNKVKELKSFTRGAVYNKNNKLMGFATHGGRKPLLLTGGVNNQFSVGDIKIGTSIASLEIITKMALYYFHERAWYNINFGINNRSNFRKNGKKFNKARFHNKQGAKRN